MKFSTLMLDILRWILGLVIMAFVLNYSVIGIFYVFEFFVSNLISLNLLFYILVWIFFVFLLLGITYGIYSLIFIIMAYIVRQRKIFRSIVSSLFGIIILLTLILFWSNTIEFSWEVLPYSSLNKLFFSLYMLSFIYIPFNIIIANLDEE